MSELFKIILHAFQRVLSFEIPRKEGGQSKSCARLESCTNNCIKDGRKAKEMILEK